MDQDKRFADLLKAASEGTMNRRGLLKRAAALGLSAPAIAALLAACGGDDEGTTTGGATTTTGGTGAATATRSTGTTGGGTTASPAAGGAAASPAGVSTKRGGGGELRLLWWQAPVILNCHLSAGTKDYDAGRVVLEPLLETLQDGTRIPVLAAEVPAIGKGLADDGKSVTYKLRQGVKWHDGQEFTAEDVKFTYEWVSDPKTAAVSAGNLRQVQSVEVVDKYTVKVNFKDTNPDWFTPFHSGEGVIIPKHIMQDFTGEKARTAPFNLKPIGTGPYKVVDFKPGDVVVYEINMDYWEAGKPSFDRITMKGGGDSTGASRAVVQSGEADYAWNIQTEEAVMKQIETSGQAGVFFSYPGGGTEKMLMNWSDPETEKDGQRAHKDVPHPHFKELKVRQALNFAVDRDTIANQLYGRGGKATPFTQNKVERIFPDGIKYEFNLDKAKALLDEVGARPGSGGIRELNGRPMRWSYQTSVNSVRQKHQEIVKQALEKIGVTVELRSIDAAVYFSGDPGNEQTTNHFYADIEMYTNSPSSPFPIIWYQRYLSREIAQKENQWSGQNYARINSPEFDRLYDQVSKELDESKSTALFKQIMTLVWNQMFEIGVISRQNVRAKSKKLQGQNPSGWLYDTYDIKNWTMQR